MNELIDKLQRFVGIDLRYIARGGFWLWLEQAAAIGTSMILTVAFANLISQQIYGTYRYILSVFGLLTIFTLPNMDVAFSTAVSRGQEGGIRHALRERMRWGLLGAIGAIGTAVYYFVQGNQVLGYSLIMVGICLPFTDSFNLYSGYLRGRRLFHLKAQYSIVIRTVSALALIATIYFTDNIYIILAAFFIPYIVLRIFFFFLTTRNYPPNADEDPQMVSYGRHLSTMQFLGSFINYIDNLLIFHYLGAPPLAIYTVAMAPVTKVQQIFSVLPELAMPKFSVSDLATTRRTLPRKIMQALLPTALVIAAYIFVAPYVFKIFFPKYMDAVPYTQIAAFILTGLPFSLIYTLFQAKALKAFIYKYNFIIRFVQLAFVLALVPFFGIWGAIAARLAFQSVSIVLLLFMLRDAGSVGETARERVE